MKNRLNFLGVIALVAVIGFVGVSCDDGGGGDDFSAPSPSIPSPTRTVSNLSAPTNFFSTTTSAVPTGREVQQEIVEWLGDQIFALAYSLYGIAQGDTSTVPSTSGGTFNFSTDLTTTQRDSIGGTNITVEDFRGVLTSTAFDYNSFYRNPDSNGSVTIRTTTPGSFNFAPTGTITGDGNRIFGSAAMSMNTSMNWNRMRVNGQANDGLSAVVGFVYNYTSGGTTTIYTGYASIRSGWSYKFEGRSRDQMSGDFYIEGTGNSTDKSRDATAQTFQVELFNSTNKGRVTINSTQWFLKSGLSNIPNRFNWWGEF